MEKYFPFVFLVKINAWIIWNLYIFVYFILRHKQAIIDLSIFRIFERVISLQL